MATPEIPHLTSRSQVLRAESMLVAAYRAGITDPKELANFMGQLQHESRNFARLEENLNYSGERLHEVFKDRNGLTAERATELAGIPDRTERHKAIAEQIYGGADGKTRLGNTEPGDGYHFRGRGYMQITGRGNYTALAHATGLDLVNRPELAAEQGNAEKLAIHYWKAQVQPDLAARTDVTVAGSLINTGRNDLIPKGLADRQASAAAWEKAIFSGYLKEALARHPLPEEAALPLKPTRELSPASLQLLRDSEHHVRALADRHGLPWDQGMENTVHALAAEAREQGLSGITHLKVAGGQIRFAQQHRGEPLREAEIDALTAANTRVDQSFGRLQRADEAAERDAAVAPATPEPVRTQAPALAV